MEIQKQQDDDQKYNKMKQEYLTKISSLENEIFDLNVECIEQKKKFESIDQNNTEFSQKMLASKNEEIDELNKEIENLRKAEEQSLNEISQLRKNVTKIHLVANETETNLANRHKEALNQLKDQIELLNDKLKVNAENSINQAQILSNEHDKKIGILKDENDQLLKDLHSVQDVNTNLKFQMVNLQSQMNESLEVKDEIIGNLNRELAELHLGLQKKDEEVKVLNDYCLQLNDVMQKSNEKNKSCEIEIEQLTKKHQELNEIYLKNYQMVIEENKLTNSLKEQHAVEVESLNIQIM